MAGITFTGQIGVGSVLAFLTSFFGFLAVYIQVRGSRRHVERVENKVDAVNSAVNGVKPGEKPLVKNVQEIHDQLTSLAAQEAFDSRE
jgi:hypothetical protein